MGSNDFVDLINNNILNALSEIHTITIAKIVKVETNTIDVKPVFKRKLEDSEVEYPVFTKVPPIFLNGGSNYHSFPLVVGDYCLLMVNERCYDNWYEGIDNKTPLEYRMFDYSDSFALVGIQPKKSAIVIPTDGRTHQIGNTLANGDYEQNGNYTHAGNREQTGNYDLVGNQTIQGNLTVTGTLTVLGDIVLNGVSLESYVHGHTHSQSNDSNGNSEADTDAATIP